MHELLMAGAAALAGIAAYVVLHKRAAGGCPN